jgi:acyl carrier protein
MVLDTLLEDLSAILRQSPATLDVNRPVLDFGVDSLMAVELRTALEIRLGVQLPLMLLSGATTLRAMAGRLLATVQTGDPAHSEAPDDVTATILRHEGARAPLNHDAAS